MYSICFESSYLSTAQRIIIRGNEQQNRQHSLICKIIFALQNSSIVEFLPKCVKQTCNRLIVPNFAALRCDEPFYRNDVLRVIDEIKNLKRMQISNFIVHILKFDIYSTCMQLFKTIPYLNSYKSKKKTIYLIR